MKLLILSLFLFSNFGNAGISDGPAVVRLDSFRVSANTHLSVEIDGDLNVVQYYLMTFGEGTHKQKIQREQISYPLWQQVVKVEKLLEELRELKKLNLTFPQKAYSDRERIKSGSQELAQQFAKVLQLGELRGIETVWIGRNGVSEPLHQFLRARLYETYHVILDPLVMAWSPGYRNAVWAATLDKVARKIFWKTLASQLYLSSTFVLKIDPLRVLRNMIEMASTPGGNALLTRARSCLFYLTFND